MVPIFTLNLAAGSCLTKGLQNIYESLGGFLLTGKGYFIDMFPFYSQFQFSSLIKQLSYINIAIVIDKKNY